MLRKGNLLIVLGLVIISALTYLPLVGTFGYFNDDWYLMYSASAYGPNTFIDIFSVDRPGRALVVIPAYMFFGENPLYYNLSAYVFRLGGALALLWLLNMLWPGKRVITTLMSLLFLIYPGLSVPIPKLNVCSPTKQLMCRRQLSLVLNHNKTGVITMRKPISPASAVSGTKS